MYGDNVMYEDTGTESHTGTHRGASVDEKGCSTTVDEGCSITLNDEACVTNVNKGL